MPNFQLFTNAKQATTGPPRAIAAVTMDPWSDARRSLSRTDLNLPKIVIPRPILPMDHSSQRPPGLATTSAKILGPSIMQPAEGKQNDNRGP